MDLIHNARTVVFVGDYFTLMTTVVLDPDLQFADESEEDFALRLASDFMKEYYGWDVADASIEIGVMDDSYEDDEEES